MLSFLIGRSSTKSSTRPKSLMANGPKRCLKVGQRCLEWVVRKAQKRTWSSSKAVDGKIERKHQDKNPPNMQPSHVFENDMER